jgi:hypothetical protein
MNKDLQIQYKAETGLNGSAADIQRCPYCQEENPLAEPKVTDDYVKWLEDQVIEFQTSPVVDEGYVD